MTAGLMIVIAYLSILLWRTKQREAYYRLKYFQRENAIISAMMKDDEPSEIPLPAPQQTRIFGDAKTEDLIASWLEKGWSPLGDDLTDTENSIQIAARIRRGEYLNELVSPRGRDIRGDAG